MSTSAEPHVDNPRRTLRPKGSTLILFIFLLLVITGWLVERSVRETTHEAQIEGSASVNANIGYTLGLNLVYSELDSESPKRIRESRHVHLTTAIWLLYLTHDAGTSKEKELSLLLAKRALELLNCANIKELRTRVNDASSYCSLTEEFIDPENPHYERVEDFVRRALEVP